MSGKPTFPAKSTVWLRNWDSFDIKKCKVTSVRRVITRYLGLFARGDSVMDGYYLSDTRGRPVQGLTSFSEESLYADELTARKAVVSDLEKILDNRRKELDKISKLYEKHLRRIKKLEDEA